MDKIVKFFTNSTKNINSLSFLLMLTILIIDFFVRKSEMSAFNIKDCSFYSLSALYLFALIREFLYWQSNGKRTMIITMLIYIVFVFIILGSFSYYAYFSILPNVFTFEYMYEEFHDFANIMKDNISLRSAGFFSATIAILFYIVKYLVNRLHVKKRNKYDIIVSIVVIIGLSLAFNNNVRMNPGAFNPLVNTLFSFSKATISKLSGRNTSVRTFTQPSRIKLTNSDKELPVNVLIILNESLRAANCSTHGYERETTPNLNAFIEENKAITYNCFYANCSRTGLAVPSLMSGINPVQPGHILYNIPIFSNYAKTFKNVSTFAISAHSYQWYNIDVFLQDGSWDYFVHRGNANYSARDHISFDDKYLKDAFNKYLSELPNDKVFAGVINFYGTHAPYYTSDDDHRKFNDGNKYDQYDNSVSYLDININRILQILKQKNMLRNTIIISTSDHAEALGEHNYNGHLQTFYDEEARVPGWIYIPEELRKQNLWNDKYNNALSNKNMNISNTDIIPTIMDIMGLWDLSEYKSVREKLLGSPITQQMDSNRVIRCQNYNDVSTSSMFVGVGLKYRQYKYLLNSRHRKFVEEIYDLKNDPYEKKNIINNVDSNIVNKFHSVLKEYNNSEFIYKQFKKQ